jgi:hypothetical protein
VEAAIRNARGQCAFRVHQQADAILDRHRMFGEPGGDIRVEAETIQVPGAHSTAASRVDDQQNLQVLGLAVFARDQRAASRRRLPVDARECITAHVITKLQ